jgi:hypothetical protein
MHAFILGCGRFPHFDAALGVDREATVAGAREIIALLQERADDFMAPLATIECLLSDPKVKAGDDTLAVSSPHDPRQTNKVDPVLRENVAKAGDDWIDRCKAGDHLFFYMSTHGIAEEHNALGVCEDVMSSKRRKWYHSLNISTLAIGLAAKTNAGRAWIFFDACQEIVPELFGRFTGTPGLHLIEDIDTRAVARGKRPFALAASKLGTSAWAPTDGKPPFFTQALLHGMRYSCVEAIDGVGWVVTGEKLAFSLSKIAEAALDWRGLQPEQLVRFNEPNVALLRIATPEVPVIIRTAIESHLPQALGALAVCDDNTVEPIAWIKSDEMAWRFSVAAHPNRRFTVTLNFENGVPHYKPCVFDALPPAKIKVLVQ